MRCEDEGLDLFLATSRGEKRYECFYERIWLFYERLRQSYERVWLFYERMIRLYERILLFYERTT